MSMMVSPQASAVTGRRNLYTASMVPAINAQIPYLYQNRQLENQQRQWEEQQRQWQKEYDQAQSQFEQSYDLNKSIADRNYQLAQEQAAQQKKNAKTAMLVQGLQGVGNLYSAYKMGQGGKRCWEGGAAASSRGRRYRHHGSSWQRMGRGQGFRRRCAVQLRRFFHLGGGPRRRGYRRGNRRRLGRLGFIRRYCRRRARPCPTSSYRKPV